MTDRPDLKDLDAEPSDGPWCCNGNAEDCALCTDPNPPYPFLCPGHPRTAANERIVGEATQAAELSTVNPIADAVAAELHRRAVRLEELRPFKQGTCMGCPSVQVDGEVIGLLGALGIVLGGQVPGGTADQLGQEYYQAWLDRAKEGRV